MICPSSQSTTDGGASSNALDDNLGTWSKTSDNAGFTWFRINFEKIVTLQSFEFKILSMMSVQQLVNFEVRVGNVDLFSSTSNALCIKYPGSLWWTSNPVTPFVKRIQCENERQGQFLFLINQYQGVGSNRIEMQEFITTGTFCTNNTFCTIPETCMACTTGTYKDTTGSAQCTNCTVGTYANKTGSSTCFNCPTKQTSGIGSTSINNCTANTPCNAGYTGPNGNCAPCATGTYKDVTGSAACTACSAGKYSATTAAIAATNCSACPANSNSLNQSSSATACTCNAGYSGVNGGECTACAAGSYKPTTGSAACTCNAGYTGPDGGPCTACAPGSYKATTGSAACTSCPAFSGATCALCGTSMSCICKAYTDTVCTECVATSAPASTSSDDCVCGPGLYDANGV